MQGQAKAASPGGGQPNTGRRCSLPLGGCSSLAQAGLDPPPLCAGGGGAAGHRGQAGVWALGGAGGGGQQSEVSLPEGGREGPAYLGEPLPPALSAAAPALCLAPGDAAWPAAAVALQRGRSRYCAHSTPAPCLPAQPRLLPSTLCCAAPCCTTAAWSWCTLSHPRRASPPRAGGCTSSKRGSPLATRCTYTGGRAETGGRKRTGGRGGASVPRSSAAKPAAPRKGSPLATPAYTPVGGGPGGGRAGGRAGGRVPRCVPLCCQA